MEILSLTHAIESPMESAPTQTEQPWPEQVTMESKPTHFGRSQ